MTKQVFDAVRRIKGKPLSQADVDAINAALAGEMAYPPRLTASKAACELMHEFEGLRLAAYPDPGSRDGNPWTIGYGSTGPGIHKGVVWSQAQAEARFEQDVAAFSAEVADLIGDAPTTQNEMDAMVALAYNIGIKAFANSTVLRKHKAGDYAGAKAAFALWNKNDGKVMRGLVRRRAAEADLYGGGV